jgi:hypothetical protein
MFGRIQKYSESTVREDTATAVTTSHVRTRVVQIELFLTPRQAAEKDTSFA